MAETTFSVTYDGDAIADGRMDVQDLAPALLALAEVFREANLIVNPVSPPVTLQIQATTAGSFDVDLVLAHLDLIQRAVSFFAGDPVEALLNLKEIVFGTGTGLLFLIRWLRRRKVRQELPGPEPGSVTLELEDGTRLAIPATVASLYRNVRIRRRVREVVRPLERDGIDRVKFRSEDTELEFSSDELAEFDVPSEAPEVLLDRPISMAVSIAAPAFIEDNKWRLSDGDRTFFATIEDNDFLTRVDEGEPFRKGDILECEMRIFQTRTDTGLHTEYSVQRVTRHIPRALALQLPFDTAVDPSRLTDPDTATPGHEPKVS